MSYFTYTVYAHYVAYYFIRTFIFIIYFNSTPISLKYGYIKWGTHARVFSRTLVHSKIKEEKKEKEKNVYSN